MEQDKSTFGSVLVHYYNLKRHWICSAERVAISLSLSCTHIHAVAHSYTPQLLFISGGELNTPGQRHVQPQLQIDHLSSTVASALFSPSAQHIFILSYCSYGQSLDKEREAMKESERPSGLKMLLNIFPLFLFLNIQ